MRPHKVVTKDITLKLILDLSFRSQKSFMSKSDSDSDDARSERRSIPFDVSIIYPPPPHTHKMCNYRYTMPPFFQIQYLTKYLQFMKIHIKNINYGTSHMRVVIYSLSLYIFTSLKNIFWKKTPHLYIYKLGAYTFIYAVLSSKVKLL